MNTHDTTAADRLSAHTLRRTLGYIQENLAERMSVEDIAGASGLSICHFTRMFKSAVGVPPRRYVTQVRFELAKKLIRAGRKNFTQIAAEAGFADQSHMTHVFIRMAGMTPRTFRRGLDSRPAPGDRKDFAGTASATAP